MARARPVLARPHSRRRCASSSRVAARRSPRPTCATTCAGSTRPAAGGSTRASTGWSARPRRSASRWRASRSRPGRLVLAGDIDRAARTLATHFPPRSTRSTCSTTSRSSSPGPLDRRARRAAARDRRRRGPRPRLHATACSAASVNRGLAAGETRRVDPRVPRRALAHRHPAAARVPGGARPPAPASARCASPPPTRPMRRRALDDALRRRAARAHRSPSTSRSASLGLRQVGPHRLLSRFARRRACSGRSPTRATRSSPRTRNGEIVRLRRHRLAPAPPPPPKTRPDRRAPRPRARDGRRGSTEQAWLARQLEVAARAKETLTVTVRMPGRSDGRLPARAGERRQRPPARPRPQGRHRAHAAAVARSRRSPPRPRTSEPTARMPRRGGARTKQA